MATYSINKIKLPNGDIVTIDGGEGTVTNVSVTNTGGLTVTGSPITSTGTISIGHANASITSQTTSAVYAIKYDSYGHITYGSAVTIPTVNNAELTFKKDTTTVKSFTANASTGVTVTFATGTVLSSASLTGSETAIDTTKFSGGSFTGGTFTGGSFTQGTFTANTPTSVTYTVSGTGTLASPGTLVLSVTAGTAATHAADSFTAATHASDSFTAAKLNTGFYTAGTLGLSTSTMTVLSNVS